MKRRNFVAVATAAVFAGCLEQDNANEGGDDGDESKEEDKPPQTDAGLRELVVYWLVTEPPAGVPVTGIDGIENEDIVDLVEEADGYLDDDELRQEYEKAAEETGDHAVVLRGVGETFDDEDRYRAVERELNELPRSDPRRGRTRLPDGTERCHHRVGCGQPLPTHHMIL